MGPELLWRNAPPPPVSNFVHFFIIIPLSEKITITVHIPSVKEQNQKSAKSKDPDQNQKSANTKNPGQKPMQCIYQASRNKIRKAQSQRTQDKTRTLQIPRTQDQNHYIVDTKSIKDQKKKNVQKPSTQKTNRKHKYQANRTKTRKAQIPRTLRPESTHPILLRIRIVSLSPLLTLA